MLKKLRPAGGAGEPRETLGNSDARGSKTIATPRQAIIRAELSGSDMCSAVGIAARAYAPVLELCRQLLAAGQNPVTPLHAYRLDVLCLTIRSIGEAAGLEINGDGTGFRRRRAPDAASPVAQIRRAAP
jgi:hypothetical protein